MDFDKILSSVGDYGRYQKMLVLLRFIVTVFNAEEIFSNILISAVPGHHCHLPVTAEKASLFRRSLAASENYEQAIKSLFIPRDAEGDFAKCVQFDVDVNSIIDRMVAQYRDFNASIIEDFVVRNRWPTVQCVDGWDYDTTYFTDTLATEYNAVCDREWLVSAAGSAFFVGGIIGSVIAGWVSDGWGRRPACFLSLIAMLAGSFAAIFPPNYPAYIIMRFGAGFSYPAAHSMTFLIAIEMVGPKKRMPLTLTGGLAFGLGLSMLALAGYFMRDWQTLQTATTVPMLLVIGCYWLLPESPRWLVSKNRMQEAGVVLQRVADVNKVSLPPNFLRDSLAKLTTAVTSTKQSSRVGLSQLLEHRGILMTWLKICFIYTSVSATYYGTAIAIGNLSVGPHLSLFFYGFLGMPAVWLLWVTMDRFGRIPVLFGGLLFSSVFCFAEIFVPADMAWLSALLPALSRVPISVAFAGLFILAGELFPTVIRGSALSSCSTASQVALIVVPYIFYLGKLYGNNIPFCVFGVLSGISSILILTLPETLDSPLPMTLQDAENYEDFVRSKKQAKEISLASDAARDSV